MAERKYPTEPLKCWGKAKELRNRYYRNYASAKEKGGLCYSGGAWTMEPIVKGLGDDVWSLTAEPYAAVTSSNKDFALQCTNACDAAGYCSDLCGYMRVYIGSLLLDKYTFGGGFPKPDFMFQTHICCTHSKWLQIVGDLLGGIPLYSIDVSVGPYSEIAEHKLEYVVTQMHEGIEWLERITGRVYDDEKLIQAIHNYCRIGSLWAEVCALNKAVPAPLDEKSMFTLFALTVLDRSSQETLAFYQELVDEVKDRVDGGIAAVGNERLRFITDGEPPWAFLSLWRHLESRGGVSIGSEYIFCLTGMWEDQEDGTWGPKKPPQQKGIQIRDRDHALRVFADWELDRPTWIGMYDPRHKSEMERRMIQEWHCSGAIMHFNRGCEGSSMCMPEVKAGLIDAGIRVFSYEGNMADPKGFDEAGTLAKIDTFIDTL